MTLLRIGPPETGGGSIRGQRRHWSKRATCRFNSCCCLRDARLIAIAVQLPTEERQDQADDNANEEAGDDRKVESGIAAFDPDVAGQTAQPASPEPTPEREAKDRDYDAKQSE